jgi:hypothetical protein
MLRQTSSRILIATVTEENNEERRFGAATPNRISVYPEQRPLFLQLYKKEEDAAGYEVSSDGNRLARALEKEVRCQVVQQGLPASSTNLKTFTTTISS